MTNQFEERYLPHERHSVHTDGSTADNSCFSHALDQVNSGDTIMVYRLNRLFRDVQSLHSSLQATGVRIIMVPQSTESGEHYAE